MRDQASSDHGDTFPCVTTADFPAESYRDRIAGALPREQLRDSLRELERTRREIDTMIDQIRNVLALSNGTARSYPPKREAVLQLMRQRPGRRMALSEIRAELIERGWLPDTKKAGHALQMTVLSLLKEGILERPETGFYVLPQYSIPAATREVAFPSFGAVPLPSSAHLGAEVVTPTNLHGREGEG